MNAKMIDMCLKVIYSTAAAAAAAAVVIPWALHEKACNLTLLPINWGL